MTTTTRTRTWGAVAVPLVAALIWAGLAPAASATPATSKAAATVAAAVPAAGSPTAACQTGSSSTSLTQVTGAAAQAAIDAVTGALAQGAIATHAPAPSIDLAQAKVYTVSTEGPNYTSVTVPVRGEYTAISNLTVVLDASGAVAQSGETLIGRSAADTFTISNYVDGQLTRSTDTGLPFLTDAQLARQPVGEAPVTTLKSPGQIAACVAAVLGVSGATAYLIVGACTGACGVPLVGTAVCVACIGAYAAVGGASIGAVASCF